MAGLTSVELTVSGVLNGQQFSASGTLSVDSSQGTKSGTVTYETPLPPGAAGAESTTVGTGKCFIGAKSLEKRRFVGPLELLGRDFLSLRLTSVGQHGSVSVSENAHLEGAVLHSHLTTVGHLKTPRVRSIGPLREVITVTGPDTLVGEGRYAFVTSRRRRIPVRYVHFYRALRPSRLLGRMRGQKFLLRATIATEVRGRRMMYRSRSTIRRI